jgi:hypothetical protein
MENYASLAGSQSPDFGVVFAMVLLALFMLALMAKGTGNK